MDLEGTARTPSPGAPVFANGNGNGNGNGAVSRDQVAEAVARFVGTRRRKKVGR
jgi:hypothetical protein